MLGAYSLHRSTATASLLIAYRMIYFWAARYSESLTAIFPAPTSLAYASRKEAERREIILRTTANPDRIAIDLSVCFPGNRPKKRSQPPTAELTKFVPFLGKITS